MEKEKDIKIAHINGKYLIIAAVIALTGTLATIYINDAKIEQTKTETQTPKVEDTLLTSRPISQEELEEKEESNEKPNSPPTNENIDDQNFDGIIITIRDNDTKEPIPNVIVSLTGFSKTFQTDDNGNFIIPHAFIEDHGSYNMAKAFFKKNGYVIEEQNIALSESHSLFLSKSK